MEQGRENNFAYIDAQNLYLGVQEMGWKLDYKRFRVYLREKYQVQKAYIFIGYIYKYEEIYRYLRECDFELVFKPMVFDKKIGPKGNVDADLVLRAIIDYFEYRFDKAVIVTSDGDFYSLVEYFFKRNILKLLVSTRKVDCSSLLKKTAKGRIIFLNELKDKLEYK